MRIRILALALVCLASSFVYAQSEPPQVAAILKEEILAPDVSLFQLKEYILSRIAKPPEPASLQSWEVESAKLREHLLRDVVFHGWPGEWVSAPPRFEDLGVIETGKGYRMRKLRYEIVPGFQSTAILYEPEKLQGKIPAILNVNGHVGPIGKAVEYKQKRCINFAKRGILALSLEWLAFGELTNSENLHLFGAHLDLVGANELGLFVLAMRKGVDYLYDHPNTDRDRLGMTGLSGGAWQTIVLSSLDQRVRVAVPVAGFTSLQTRVEVRDYGDLGDIEQSGTDLLDGQDYSHLAALLAPRPSLFGFNAEDNCCFRAPLVKPLIYDAVRPIYKLYGKEDNFEWHENRDPGTHNYQLDHRLQAYRFFSHHFNLPPIEAEIPSDSEIKGYEELVVGLPKDNLTILGLARKLASGITRPPIPQDAAGRQAWAASERAKLKTVVRYKPVRIERVWTVANTKNKGVETLSYSFAMNNKLSAEAVWLKSIEVSENVPATIVLNDKGKRESAADVSDRLNRGEQVLAFDPVFTGSAWQIKTPATPERETGPWAYIQFLHAIGDRAIGLEAAQLIEIAKWLKGRSGVTTLCLESRGMRNQVAALIASALEPELFSEVVTREGIPSLSYLLQKPVEYQQAAELFCLDFYKEFDLDRLAAMCGSTRIVSQ
jgi:dienelactone hydrolase